MKRLSTAAKLERESQSTYNRANLDDSNPYVYNYSSDSEPVSERKIQKKRDTYQKIPDDVRVQILESVQNGETLKSAAKRFQINYSSAKSILHTYRKEGRILKKSAQERTIKKRVINDEDEKPTKQAAKPLKKETVKNNKKAVAPLAERITSASTCASYSDEKSSPVQGQDSLVSTLKMEHQTDAKSLTLQPMVHEDYNTSPLESYNMNRASRQNGMPMDNFYKSYHYQDMGGDYYRNDMSDYQSNMYSNDFDPLSVLQPRMPKNEEAYGSNTFYYQKGYNNGGYNFEDKTSRTENGLYYEENLENSGNPLKSFMDSQMMLQEALKKTNFWTGSGNQNFRKSSFDMF